MTGVSSIHPAGKYYIGDICYVPTQEIIDELSDDDYIEQIVICFH